jgi:hypothetical protein
VQRNINTNVVLNNKATQITREIQMRTIKSIFSIIHEILSERTKILKEYKLSTIS